jgi:hypothetical protein|tara:strand:+ start:195 stop:887 length:693 start_codon:yes stop_codon:yes gene_type:complete
MKNLIYLILLIPIISLSQKKTILELTHDQSQDINYYKTVKNNTQVLNYILADGNKVSVGDTLIIGLPTSQSSISNTYAGGAGIAGVARTNTRSKKEFEFVQRGRPAGFGNVMGALGGEGPSMAGADLANEVVKIDEMKVVHKGSKKKPLQVILVIGEINGRAFGVNKYLSVLDAELAISYGEIKLKNAKMTRAEAIAKLKESKELLDLELMTQEEYDKIRTELTPIIRGN